MKIEIGGMILVVFSLAGSGMINLSHAEPRKLGRVSVEFDPMTTVLGTRNFLVNYSPPSLTHWNVSGVVFASDFPSWIDDILSYRNREQNFDLSVDWSPGITIDYYFSKERSRWHAGMFMFLWRYEAKRNGDTSRFINHVLLPRVGYRWFPFKEFNFYLDPFAGLMSEYRIRGENRVDGEEVKPTYLIPFATVHAGFHF